jgi:hypothetical protein
MAELLDTLDHEVGQEPLVPRRRAALQEIEARAEVEARVNVLIEQASPIGTACQ